MAQPPAVDSTPVQIGGLEVGRDEAVERNGEDPVLVVFVGLL